MQTISRVPLVSCLARNDKTQVGGYVKTLRQHFVRDWRRTRKLIDSRRMNSKTYIEITRDLTRNFYGNIETTTSCWYRLKKVFSNASLCLVWHLKTEIHWVERIFVRSWSHAPYDDTWQNSRVRRSKFVFLASPGRTTTRNQNHSEQYFLSVLKPWKHGTIWYCKSRCIRISVPIFRASLKKLLIKWIPRGMKLFTV